MSSYEDGFSAVAGDYASRRPHYPGELFTYLGRVCERHELAWDCAAGTGQASIPLTRMFQRVIATDASHAMLKHATRHPRVDYRVARANSSGIPSSSVDLVTVAQALHWLKLDAFYAEAKRVLVPAGVLAVWTYGVQVLEDERLNSLVQAFYSDTVGPYWAAERRHVESGYRTLPFPYPELTAPTFTMHEEWTLAELLGYLSTWSATQNFRKARGQDPVEGLASKLAPLWGDEITRRRISWPLSIRLGRRPA